MSGSGLRAETEETLEDPDGFGAWLQKTVEQHKAEPATQNGQLGLFGDG